MRVAANIVVNAAGPWVDEIARMEQNPPASLLHLSKGIHVVVPRERFSVNHLIICNTSDKRSIFTIPRGDVVYVGTTDTSYRGRSSALWPEIDLDDVEYLLEPLARYFDAEPLSPSDVVAAWAGVRPADRHGRQGPEGAVPQRRGDSRPWSDDLHRGRQTHRLSPHGRRCPQSRGRAARQGPAGRSRYNPDSRRQSNRLSTQSDQEALRLWRLYGSEAEDIRSLDSVRLVDDAPVVRGEVDWAVQVEAATTLARCRLSSSESCLVRASAPLGTGHCDC